MSNVKLLFYPNGTGGKGAYEMFIDFDCSTGASTMVFDAPIGWTTQAIKLYPVTVNSAGKVIPNVEKSQDKATLNAPNADYSAVFDTATLPTGFSFDAASSTLSSTGAIANTFEFLIWIQDSSSGNDYLDPGLKNHK